MDSEKGRARFEGNRLCGKVTAGSRWARLHWQDGEGFMVATVGAYLSPSDVWLMRAQIAECHDAMVTLKDQADELLAAHEARLNAGRERTDP